MLLLVETTGITTTQAFIMALIAAIPPTLTAWAAFRQSQRNASLTRVNDAKTDGLVKQVEQVHVLTNSNLTAVKSQLEMAEREIEKLHATVVSLVEQRGEVLRQTATKTRAEDGPH